MCLLFTVVVHLYVRVSTVEQFRDLGYQFCDASHAYKSNIRQLCLLISGGAGVGCTRECVHLVIRGHFRGHMIKMAVTPFDRHSGKSHMQT